MPLTTEEKAAIIAAVTAAVDGTPSAPAAPALPWYKDTSSPVPTVPLTDLTNEAEVKRYMAHGLRPNLKRGVAPKDWPAYIAIADRIAAAATPDEANLVMPGAGYFAPDAAILLVLGGAVQGMGPFQSPSLFAPWGAGFDIAHAADWLDAQPGFAGPGGN